MSAASWGLFQVLGSNYKAAGFPTVQEFVRAHVEGGERSHLEAALRFMAVNGLIEKLRRGDWRGFARGYNGRDYEKNAYHVKLQKAIEKYIARAA